MVSKRQQAVEKKRLEQKAALDKVKADKIQRAKALEKKKMADIAKKKEAARVAEQAAAAAAAEAAAKLDGGAKGQDMTGNINKEVQKEKERKQVFQTTAQEAENKGTKRRAHGQTKSRHHVMQQRNVPFRHPP